MSFVHERLDVYQSALDFVVQTAEVIARLPPTRSHLSEQLHRASTSVVLHIAEGAAESSKLDQRRLFLAARSSATECAALYDILAKLGAVTADVHGATKEKLFRIATMIVKLAKDLEHPLPFGHVADQ